MVRESDTEEYKKACEGLDESRINEKELTELQANENNLIVIDVRDSNHPKLQPDKKIDGSITITLQDMVDEVVNEKIPDKQTRIVLVCFASFSECRRVALTTYAYPTLKLMGYENVNILNNWWGRKHRW